MTLAVNFLAFQIGWLAAVLSASKGVPWIGVLAMVAAIVLHLLRARLPREELILLLLCGAIGAVWDSVLVAVGWIRYPSGNVSVYLAPYWIVAMWMLFATTLNVSMNWLKFRYLLASAFGFFGGPLSFYAGHKLGGVELVEFKVALLAQAVGWAAMMPLLLDLAHRHNGMLPATAGKHRWMAD
jgi:hypothetical protein